MMLMMRMFPILHHPAFLIRHVWKLVIPRLILNAVVLVVPLPVIPSLSFGQEGMQHVFGWSGNDSNPHGRVQRYVFVNVRERGGTHRRHDDDSIISISIIIATTTLYDGSRWFLVTALLILWPTIITGRYRIGPSTIVESTSSSRNRDILRIVWIASIPASILVVVSPSLRTKLSCRPRPRRRRLSIFFCVDPTHKYSTLFE
jgi:hypothetical protein